MNLHPDRNIYIINDDESNNIFKNLTQAQEDSVGDSVGRGLSRGHRA